MGTHFKGTADETRALDVYIKLTRASEFGVVSNQPTSQGPQSCPPASLACSNSLHHLGPMCQSELAAKILKSTGNLTMVVDHLEQRGLVERRRDTGDRRFITVHLTEGGEALIGGIFAEHAAGVVREIGVLTAEEQMELAGLCRKLGKGLDSTDWTFLRRKVQSRSSRLMNGQEKMQPIRGIHHITAIASSPQANVDFYHSVLGQRLIKRTVNFDDPGSYHLYYGDEVGSPGTIMTFFAWPGVRRGRSATARSEHRPMRFTLSRWTTGANDWPITASAWAKCRRVSMPLCCLYVIPTAWWWN